MIKLSLDSLKAISQYSLEILKRRNKLQVQILKVKNNKEIVQDKKQRKNNQQFKSLNQH
jgi:hypothetical protein